MSMDPPAGQAVDDLPRLAPRMIPADLRPIASVTIYEVLEDELNQLDEIVSAENQALGFATACGSAFVGAAVSALTDWPESPSRALAFEVICVALLVGTGWFGITWHRTRRRRPSLLEKIRQRGRAGIAAT